MRILHVVPSVSLVRGGPSSAVLAMCRALAQQGVDVHLATTTDDGTAVLPVTAGTAVASNGYELRYFSRQAAVYTTSFPLLRWLAGSASSYDLIHVHAVFTHVSDWAPPIARQLCVPYGITTHGILGSQALRSGRQRLKRLYVRLVVQANVRGARFVHFTSDRERRQTENGIRPARSVVFPIGVQYAAGSLPERRADPYPAGVLRLLFLSRIDEVKGLDKLLPAIAIARQEGLPLELVIAGTGEPTYVSKMRTMCDELQIADAVQWVGFADGPAKLRLYSNADVFVLSSYTESLGIAPLEAMAAGLPVLITDRMGISAAVMAAGAGIVVAADSRELADALHLLHTNRQMLPVISQRARKLAVEEYSLDKMASNLVELYASVVGSTRLRN